MKCIKSLLIRNRNIFHSTGIVKEGVFRPYRGIVKTGGDRVGRGYLAAFVLEYIAHRSLENPGLTAPLGIESSSMLAQIIPSTTSLDPDHLHIMILQKRIE